MRFRLAVAVVVAAAFAFAASPAEARPITAGVNLGLIQSEVNARGEPNRSLGLFGRIGVSSRLAAQLELMKIESESDGDLDVRSGGALLVLDLRGRGTLIPTLLVGGGIDRADSEYQYSIRAHHVEAGLGLEYRSEGGLTLGVDARIGGRTIDEQSAPPIVLVVVPELSSGEYRVVRASLGIRF